MNATAAITARPPRTAIAWATKDALFVEIPCKDGPPYIARYHRTAEGLALALNVLIASPDTGTRSIARDHPKVRYVGVPKPAFTDAQRAAASEALAKVMGGMKAKGAK